MQSPQETPPHLVPPLATLMERTLLLTEGTEVLSRNLYWPAETSRRRIVNDLLNHFVRLVVTPGRATHC